MVKKLYDDPCVTDNKNVFEYVLGGCQDPKLLNIRVFDDNVKVGCIELRRQRLKLTM